MGIGIGWPNASASNQQPTVYTYSINNCSGPQGLAYSTSSVLSEGVVLYIDPGLTSEVDYGVFGEPFNADTNDLIPGYFCNNFGVVFNSSILECP
jgi:hypothetical protein